MMVSNRPSVLALLGWQWKRVLFLAFTGAIAPFLHQRCGLTELVFPMPPVVIIGSAIGIFVSFRTNSCYARWWEGRQLWGRLVNNARDFASTAVANLPGEEAQRLVRRQIAHVHVLRCLLRDQDLQADPSVVAYTDERTRGELAAQRNPAFTLLNEQRRALVELTNQGALGEMRLLAFDRILGNLHDVQGGCERIKRTPFPRGYAFIARYLTLAFALLLPFALSRDLVWVAIPTNVLVGLAFLLIGEVGRVLEDPFTTFYDGLPLSALSRMIEVNLLQALGETSVPELLTPNARGILM